MLGRNRARGDFLVFRTIDSVTDTGGHVHVPAQGVRIRKHPDIAFYFKEDA